LGTEILGLVPKHDRLNGFINQECRFKQTFTFRANFDKFPTGFG
jgi:hypothetical protein